jgi:hypothetical protein
MKLLFTILIIFLSNTNASILAKYNIYYGDSITLSNTINHNDNKCKDLTYDTIKNNNYVAIHYIKKNNIICKKDIKKLSTTKVIYKFGGFLEAEEYGKVITETNKYIKIKKPNGKIKKLYKDGI